MSVYTSLELWNLSPSPARLREGKQRTKKKKENVGETKTEQSPNDVETFSNTIIEFSFGDCSLPRTFPRAAEGGAK